MKTGTKWIDTGAATQPQMFGAAERTKVEKSVLPGLHASRALRTGVVPLLACLAFALGTNPAKADLATFTGSGTGSDGPLSAQAVFTTSPGQLQVTLSNTLLASVIRSAGQTVSDLSFTLSNAPGTLGSTSATGQLGNVDGSGVVTFVAGSPTRFLGAGGQGSFSVVGSTITLETIGGGKPTQLIAPSIGNGGTFTNVNNGFQNFNPFVIGPATFTLNLAGVTAATTVTSARFSFGTGPDTFIAGTPSPTTVPEPSTIISAGIAGLVGLGYGWGRRKAKLAA